MSAFGCFRAEKFNRKKKNWSRESFTYYQPLGRRWRWIARLRLDERPTELHRQPAILLGESLGHSDDSEYRSVRNLPHRSPNWWYYIYTLRFRPRILCPWSFEGNGGLFTLNLRLVCCLGVSYWAVLHYELALITTWSLNYLYIHWHWFVWVSGLTLKEIVSALRTGHDRPTRRQSNVTSNGSMSAAAYHQVIGPVPPICIEP